MAAPWENDPIVQPARGAGATPVSAPAQNGGGLRLLVPKPADQPAAQTQTQAEIDRERLREMTTGSRVLTPQEVSQLGLPAGSYQADSKGAITKIGGDEGGLTTTDRNALIERAKSLPDFSRSVDQIEKLYKEGFKDQGIGSVLEYLPADGKLAGLRPINQQLNNASDSLIGAIAQIQGMTGGELNSLAELRARFGPMLPQASDPDDVIEQKIASLRAMAGTQRSVISAQLGPEADQYFGGRAAATGATGGQAPAGDGPMGPGDIGFSGNATPDPRGSPHTPEQAAAYNAFLSANPNVTPEQLEAFAMQLTGGKKLANAAQIIEQYRKTGTFTPGSEAVFGAPDISDVRGQGGVGEGADAVVRGAADTLSLGFGDELSAVGDTIVEGGTYADNLARQRAIDDYDAENSPWLRGTGQVAGGFALPIFGARTAAQLAKVGAAYGAAYGAGSGESMGERVGGAFTGAGVGAAAGWGGGKLADKLAGRVKVPAPASGKETAADRYARGQEFGIDLSIGDVRGMGAKATERTLDVQPGGAGVMNSARERVDQQAVAAVDKVAGRYGPTTSFVGIGEAVQKGARKWISRFEEVSSKLYDAIPISPKAPAALDNTRVALEELTTIFESNPKLADTFKNSKLNSYLDALAEGGEGLSWNDLKSLRSRVGEEIGDQRFSESPTKSELRRLYGALSEDMRITAASMGPKAARAFDRANTLYRQGQQRIDDALVKILGDDGNKSSEAAAARIQGIIKDGKASGDFKLVHDVWKSLGSEERSEVANGLIRLLGQPANSSGRAFDPGAFMRNFGDMTPEAKNLIFGAGHKDLRQNLDEFSKVIGGMAANKSTRNTSNTAMGLAGLLSFGAGGVPALLGQALLSYGAARVWTSPKVVKWATGYSKMLKGAANAGKAPTAAGHSTQMKLLEKVAASEPALAQDVFGLQKALNDAFAQSPSRAAAGQQENDAGREPVK